MAVLKRYLLLLGIFCTPLLAVMAQDVRFDVIPVNAQQLSVAAVFNPSNRVQDNLFADVQDALRAGVMLDLVYHYRLQLPERAVWRNELAHLRVQQNLHYDPLRDIFTVTLPDGRKRTWYDFNAVQGYILRAPQVLLTSKNDLKTGHDYQIRVALELTEPGTASWLSRLNVARLWQRKVLTGDMLYVAR